MSNTAPASSHPAPSQPDAWELAKTRFLTDLSPQERDLFSLATLENLFYSTSNLNREDAESSKIRSAIRKLGPFVAAIENYGKALDVYTSISPLHVAPILGSIRVLLVMAKTHGRFFDRIVEMLERIGDILPRFRDYERIYDRNKHQRLTQALSNAYLEIIIFCTQTRQAIQRQQSSSFRRAFKPLSLDREFEEALGRFRQHKENVEEEARVCHRIEAAEERRTQIVLRAAERRARVLERLSNVDCTRRHRKLIEARHEGTGLWIIDSAQYRQWMESTESSILCCHGIPGSGKSVLASSIIDTVPEGHISIFYYCDYADKRTLEPANLFGTLARQVLARLDPIAEDLTASIEKADHDGERLLDLTSACNFLQRALKLVSASLGIRAVIDGLDEVNEKSRELICLNLRKLFEDHDTVLKIFLTSREDFESSLKLSSTSRYHNLPLSTKSLSLDIGAFLWVEFQLLDLAEQESDHGILTVLRNLPRNLSETYDRLLNKIQGQERKTLVQRMFKWLVVARQPLTVGELQEAIAFTLDDDSWDREKIPTDFKRLIRACGNLVIVDIDTQFVQTGKSAPIIPVTIGINQAIFIIKTVTTECISECIIVALNHLTEAYIDNYRVAAHYTIQQYLLQPREGDYSFTLKQANTVAAETCIAYLNFSNFDMQVTKFSQNLNTDLVLLNKVADLAGEGQILPPEHPGTNLVRTWNKIRGRQLPVATIDFTKFSTKANQTVDLTPFSLLAYTINHWLWHSIAFDSKNPELTVGYIHRRDELFQRLLRRLDCPFIYRPWSNIDSETDVQKSIIGWALCANHKYLLDMSFTSTSSVFNIIYEVWADLINRNSPISLNIDVDETYLINWRQNRHSIATIPIVRDLDRVRLRNIIDLRNEGLTTVKTDESGLPFTDIWMSSAKERGWLFSQLLYACRNGHHGVIKHIFDVVPTRANSLLSHLATEAAAFGQSAVVEYFYWLSSPYLDDKSVRNFRHSLEFGRLSALDFAIAGGHLKTTSFLWDNGFKTRIRDFPTLYQLLLRSVADDKDFELLSCLLLVDRYLESLGPNPSQICIDIVAEIILCVIRSGSHDTLRQLAKCHLFIRAFSRCNINPFSLIAWLGRVQILDILIHRGLHREFPGRNNINMSLSFSSSSASSLRPYLNPTPLFIACMLGNLPLVQSLFRAGANVNLLSPTQVEIYAQVKPRDSLTAAKNFLTGRPDPSMMTQLSSWQYPIIAAALEGHGHVVDWLISSPNAIPVVYLRDDNLIMGSKLSSLLTSFELTSVALSLSQRTKMEGNTLAEQANFIEDITMEEASVLLDRGLDLDKFRPRGFHPLEFAMEFEDFKLGNLIVWRNNELLVDLDHLLNHPPFRWADSQIETVRIYILAVTAVTEEINSHVDKISALLSSSNIRRILMGDTANEERMLQHRFGKISEGDLLYNIKRYRQFVLEYIIECCDWEASDDSWADLVEWCRRITRTLQGGRDTKKAWVKQIGYARGSAVLQKAALFAAILEDDGYLVDLSFTDQKSMNWQDRSGQTPLIVFLLNFQVDLSMLNTMLQHGADPRIADNTGKNAIGYARSIHRSHILRYCEENGFVVERGS